MPDFNRITIINIYISSNAGDLNYYRHYDSVSRSFSQYLLTWRSSITPLQESNEDRFRCGAETSGRNIAILKFYGHNEDFFSQQLL